jgi:hypothetical protein
MEDFSKKNPFSQQKIKDSIYIYIVDYTQFMKKFLFTLKIQIYWLHVVLSQATNAFFGIILQDD